MSGAGETLFRQLDINFEHGRWLVSEITTTCWGEGASLKEAFHDWWVALDDTVMSLSEGGLLSPAMEARLAACRTLQVETAWPGEAAGSGRVDDVPTPTSPLALQLQPESCSHLSDWVSAPITAENQCPEHRCSSCGAVMIAGASSLDRAIGPETT